MIRTLLVGLAATALATAALAQAPLHDPQAAPPRSLQGDQSSWINDPHMHAFYELTKAAFANGPDKVDAAGFQAKSYEIFGAFGASHGMKPEAMVDHLKLIPGQVVQIAKEDPSVLASYDNFVAAIFGPQ